MKELACILVAASAVMAWPAMAQNYDGKWTGEFQAAAGTPPICTAKGPITVSVSGTTINIEVAQQGSALKPSGSLRSDGSWEATMRLPSGFTTFTGTFDGQRVSGNYTGGGQECFGTFSGSRT